MSHYFYHFVTKAAFVAAAILTFFVAQASTANAASVSLAWDASAGPGIAGYKIRYGTASQNYTLQLDVGNATTGTVSSLTPGTSYYFATTAYDTSGIESGFSNEVSYTPASATPTPTPTRTPTPTPTRTPTPAPTSTPAPTPTPGPQSLSISGNVSYCSDSAPNPVPNVTLTRTGTTGGSTVSDSSGNYQFPPLLLGVYTVTPTKTAIPPGGSGINTYDVVAIRRHFLGIQTLQGGQLAAANVNGDSTVNTTDVVAVQKFYLGQTTSIANVGKYQFTPANRTYVSILGSQTGQDYGALVLGDVIAPFADRPSGSLQLVGMVSRVQNVELPQVAVEQNVIDFVAPITITAVDMNDGLVGFQGDFTFDERVVGFQDNPIEAAGLTATSWNVSASVLPGEGPIRTLRISAYSVDLVPLAGSGTLLNLRMIRGGGTPGETTGLIWQEVTDPFVFIDSNLNPTAPGSAISGSVSLDGNPNGNP